MLTSFLFWQYSTFYNVTVYTIYDTRYNLHYREAANMNIRRFPNTSKNSRRYCGVLDGLDTSHNGL